MLHQPKAEMTVGGERSPWKENNEFSFIRRSSAIHASKPKQSVVKKMKIRDGFWFYSSRKNRLNDGSTWNTLPPSGLAWKQQAAVSQSLFVKQQPHGRSNVVLDVAMQATLFSVWLCLFVAFQCSLCLIPAANWCGRWRNGGMAFENHLFKHALDDRGNNKMKENEEEKMESHACEAETRRFQRLLMTK